MVFFFFFRPGPWALAVVSSFCHTGVTRFYDKQDALWVMPRIPRFFIFPLVTGSRGSVCPRADCRAA